MLPGRYSQRRTMLAFSTLSLKSGVPFAVRFHLHPDIYAEQIKAYDEWRKLKNLGEGEAGTGYALLSDVADLESIKSIRERDFILKLFYHCKFCLLPNDPENDSQYRFIVCQEQIRHDGIYYTIAKHKCSGCGKINKFLIK